MRRVAVCLLLAAGCRGKAEGPPCGAVATRFFALAKADLDKATVDPATRRAVNIQLPAMRDSLAQLCNDGKWSAQVRDCMVKAGDHAAVETCEQALTDEQRRALDRGVHGETPAP